MEAASSSPRESAKLPSPLPLCATRHTLRSTKTTTTTAAAAQQQQHRRTYRGDEECDLCLEALLGKGEEVVEMLGLRVHSDCFEAARTANLLREIPALPLAKLYQAPANYLTLLEQEEDLGFVRIFKGSPVDVDLAVTTVMKSLSEMQAPVLVDCYPLFHLRDQPRNNYTQRERERVPLAQFIKFFKKNCMASNVTCTICEDQISPFQKTLDDDEQDEAENGFVDDARQLREQEKVCAKSVYRAELSINRLSFASVLSKIRKLPDCIGCDGSNNAIPFLPQSFPNGYRSGPILNLDSAGYWGFAENNETRILNVNMGNIGGGGSSSNISSTQPMRHWCTLHPGDVHRVRENQRLLPFLDIGWCLRNQIPVYFGTQVLGDIITFATNSVRFLHTSAQPPRSFACSAEWKFLPKDSIDAWTATLSVADSYFSLRDALNMMTKDGTQGDAPVVESSPSSKRRKIISGASVSVPTNTVTMLHCISGLKHPRLPIMTLCYYLLKYLRQSPQHKSLDPRVEAFLRSKLKDAFTLERDIQSSSVAVEFLNNRTPHSDPDRSCAWFCEVCFRELFVSYYFCPECSETNNLAASYEASPGNGTKQYSETNSEVSSVTQTLPLKEEAHTTFSSVTSSVNENESESLSVEDGNEEEEWPDLLKQQYLAHKASPIESKKNENSSENDDAGHESPADSMETSETRLTTDSNKKNRSTIPSYLRVGKHVGVNSKSHRSGIVLKTGHGFFTIKLDESNEIVVKRQNDLYPLAIEASNTGPGKILTSASVSKPSVSPSQTEEQQNGEKKNGQTPPTTAAAAATTPTKSPADRTFPAIFCFGCAFDHYQRHKSGLYQKENGLKNQPSSKLLHWFSKIKLAALEKMTNETMNQSTSTTVTSFGEKQVNVEPGEPAFPPMISFPIRFSSSHIPETGELTWSAIFRNALFANENFVPNGSIRKRKSGGATIGERLTSTVRSERCIAKDMLALQARPSSSSRVSTRAAESDSYYRASTFPSASSVSSSSMTTINVVRSWKLNHLLGMVEMMRDKKAPYVFGAAPSSIRDGCLDCGGVFEIDLDDEIFVPVPVPIKRGRGRPRKYPLPTVSTSPGFSPSNNNNTTTAPAITPTPAPQAPEPPIPPPPEVEAAPVLPQPEPEEPQPPSWNSSFLTPHPFLQGHLQYQQQQQQQQKGRLSTSSSSS